MNIHFTKYSEKKFDILNEHGVFFTKEEIEETVKKPDKTDKKGRYLSARKENIKVVYEKDEDVLKIITFYPV